MPYTNYDNPFSTDEELAALYDEQAAENAESSPFMGGVSSGVYGLGSSLKNLLAAGGRIAGADPYAIQREREADILQAQAAGAGVATPRLADVHGLGDAYDWASGMVGQNLPLLGAMAASGMLGGAAGSALMRRKALAKSIGNRTRKDVLTQAAAEMMDEDVATRLAARQEAQAMEAVGKKTRLANALQEAINPRSMGARIGALAGTTVPYFTTTAGDTYGSIRQDPEATGTPREQALAAMGSGAMQTSLGTVFEPMVGILPVLMRGKRAAAIRAGLHPHAGPKAALKELGLAALGEGVTETGEQAIQQWTQNQFNPNLGYDTAQLLEAGLGGALVGGVYSAPTAARVALHKQAPVVPPQERLASINAALAAADPAANTELLLQKADVIANYSKAAGATEVDAVAMYNQLQAKHDEIANSPPANSTEYAQKIAMIMHLDAAQRALAEKSAVLKTRMEAQDKAASAPGIVEARSSLNMPGDGATLDQLLESRQAYKTMFEELEAIDGAPRPELVAQLEAIENRISEHTAGVTRSSMEGSDLPIQINTGAVAKKVGKREIPHTYGVTPEAGRAVLHQKYMLDGSMRTDVLDLPGSLDGLMMNGVVRYNGKEIPVRNIVSAIEEAHNNGTEITADELFDAANMDEKESKLRFRQRPVNEQTNIDRHMYHWGVDTNAYNFDTVQRGDPNITPPSRVIRSVADPSIELEIPTTLDELTRSGIRYRGTNIQAPALMHAIIDTWKGDSFIHAPELFKLAQQSYEFRRSRRPRGTIYANKDLSTGEVIYTPSADDESMYLRNNHLVKKYNLVPWKIKGNAFDEGFNWIVDHMEAQGMVLLGSMDNQLFFGTKQDRQKFIDEADLSGTLAGDINQLTRIGTIIKKESGDVREVDVTNIDDGIVGSGRHGKDANRHSHDGVIAIVEGQKINQGVSIREVVRPDGTTYYEYDKGILRSPLHRLDADGNSIAYEEQSVNNDLQFGKTRTQSVGPDSFMFYSMFPVAEQAGGSANFQQLLFGLTDAVPIYSRDRHQVIDKVTVEDLLKGDQAERFKYGVPLSAMITQDQALGWMTKVKHATSRAYVMSTDALFDVNEPADADVAEKFKARMGRDYKSGLDDVLLLQGTYEEINAKWRKHHKEDIKPGDLLILHRDPALPDASSMSAFVFKGLAALETPEGSHDKGIVVHTESAGWKDAAGDFDGDSGVLTVPDDTIWPRSKRTELPGVKVDYLKRGAAAKDPISVQKVALLAAVRRTDPTAYITDTPNFLDSTITYGGRTRDLLNELAKYKASGFSQAIGRIMTPAQKLAEIGALDDIILVKEIDVNGREVRGPDGKVLEVPVSLGVLLSKIGQASISAKKKAAWTSQAIEAHFRAQAYVGRKVPFMVDPVTGDIRRYTYTDEELIRKIAETSLGHLEDMDREISFDVAERLQGIVASNAESRMNIRQLAQAIITGGISIDLGEMGDELRTIDAYTGIRESYFIGDTKAVERAPIAGSAMAKALRKRARDADNITKEYGELTEDNQQVFEVIDPNEEGPMTPARFRGWKGQPVTRGDHWKVAVLHAERVLAARRGDIMRRIVEAGGVPVNSKEEFSQIFKDMKKEIYDKLVEDGKQDDADKLPASVLGFAKFLNEHPEIKTSYETIEKLEKVGGGSFLAEGSDRSFHTEMARRILSLNKAYTKLGTFGSSKFSPAYIEAAATITADDGTPQDVINTLAAYKVADADFAKQMGELDAIDNEEELEALRARRAELAAELRLEYSAGTFTGAALVAYGPQSVAQRIVEIRELKEIAEATQTADKFKLQVTAQTADKKPLANTEIPNGRYKWESGRYKLVGAYTTHEGAAVKRPGSVWLEHAHFEDMDSDAQNEISPINNLLMMSNKEGGTGEVVVSVLSTKAGGGSAQIEFSSVKNNEERVKELSIIPRNEFPARGTLWGQGGAHAVVDKAKTGDHIVLPVRVDQKTDSAPKWLAELKPGEWTLVHIARDAKTRDQRFYFTVYGYTEVSAGNGLPKHYGVNAVFLGTSLEQANATVQRLSILSAAEATAKMISGGFNSVVVTTGRINELSAMGDVPRALINDYNTIIELMEKSPDDTKATAAKQLLTVAAHRLAAERYRTAYTRADDDQVSRVTGSKVVNLEEEQEIVRRIKVWLEGKNKGDEKSGNAPSGPAPSGPAPSAVNLGATGPHGPKDQAKSDIANKFIGKGSPGSSTEKYKKAWEDQAGKDKVNARTYDASDVVFVSTNGNRPGRVSIDAIKEELAAAINGKATIVADAEKDRARAYNIGEQELAKFLEDNGYEEKEPGSGVWTSKENKTVEAGAEATVDEQGYRVLTPEETATVKALSNGVDFATYQNIATQLDAKLGLSGDVRVIDAETALRVARGMYSPATYNKYAEKITNARVGGSYIPNADAKYIVLLGANENRTAERVFSSFSHEYGHRVTYEKWEELKEFNPSLADRIWEDFTNYSSEVEGTQEDFSDAVKSGGTNAKFYEWLAQNASVWALKNGKIKEAAGSWYKELANKLVDLYSELKSAFRYVLGKDPETVAPFASVKEWLDSLVVEDAAAEETQVEETQVEETQVEDNHEGQEQFITANGELRWLSKDQTGAIHAALDLRDPSKPGRVMRVIGAAGTGKSTMVRELMRRWRYMYGEGNEFEGAPVLSTTTHRANWVLKLMSRYKTIVYDDEVTKTIKPATIDSVLGSRKIGGRFVIPMPTDEKSSAKTPPISEYGPGTVLIIDESSMMKDNVFRAVMAWQRENGFSVMFLGDQDQLPPVGSTVNSRALTEPMDEVRLNKVMRQRGSNPLLDYLTDLRSGKTISLKTSYNKKTGEGVIRANKGDIIRLAKKIFTEEIALANMNQFRILVSTNVLVREWNNALHTALHPNSEYKLSVGEVIIGYRSSSREEGMKNGIEYLITAIGKKKTVRGDAPRLFSDYQRSLFIAAPPFSGREISVRGDSGEVITLFVVDDDQEQAYAKLIVERERQISRLYAEKDKAYKDKAYSRMNTLKETIRVLGESYDEFKDTVSNMTDSKATISKDNDVTVTTGNFEDDDKVDVRRSFDLGYASTIHKAQGGTVNVAVVDVNSIKNFPAPVGTIRKMAYTALSRAAKTVIIIDGAVHAKPEELAQLEYTASNPAFYSPAEDNLPLENSRNYGQFADFPGAIPFEGVGNNQARSNTEEDELHADKVYTNEHGWTEKEEIDPFTEEAKQADVERRLSELDEESDRIQKIEPGRKVVLEGPDTVTLYRGANRTDDVWTTDKKKAAKDGEVAEVTIPATSLAQSTQDGVSAADEYNFLGKKPPAIAEEAKARIDAANKRASAEVQAILETLDEPTLRVQMQQAATDIGRLMNVKGSISIISALDMYNMLLATGDANNIAEAQKILAHAKARVNGGKGGSNGMHYMRASDGVHFIYVSGLLTEEEKIQVLSHEIGHGIIDQEWAALRSSNPKLAKQVADEWRKSQGIAAPKGDVSSNSDVGHMNGFHEWLADRIRDWLITKEAPRNAAGTWFSNLAQKLIAIFKIMQQAFNVPGSVDEWLTGMAKTSEQIDRVYGRGPPGMSISDRIDQRRARLQAWSANAAPGNIEILNDMIPDVRDNLDNLLSPPDVEMLRRAVQAPSMRQRIMHLVGANTAAAEAVSSDTDAAVAYLYALTTMNVMVAPPYVKNGFATLREALALKNRMLLEPTNREVDELISRLNVRGEAVNTTENLIPSNSPAARLYMERNKRYTHGVIGWLQRASQAYKAVFGSYIDEPYMRIQRTGNPVLMDAWRLVAQSAYELGGLKRADETERMRANYQIFVQRSTSLLKNLDVAERTQLSKYMLTPKNMRGSVPNKVKEAAEKFEKLLEDVYKYETKLVKVDHREGYWPFVPNHEYIDQNIDGVLNTYGNIVFLTGWLGVKNDYKEWAARHLSEAEAAETAERLDAMWARNPKEFIKFYLTNDGTRMLPGQEILQLPADELHTPSFRFSNPRELDFLLQQAHANPELHEEVLNTLNLDPKEVTDKYFRNVTKRMEHQRFLSKLGPTGYKGMIERARRAGATNDDIRIFNDSVMAVQGLLGLRERDWLDKWIEGRKEDSWFKQLHSQKTRVMNPEIQKGNSFIMAWENISHLTLSLAAASVDPAGQLAKHGSWGIFKRSISETRQMFKAMAKDMPLSSRAILLDRLGTLEHSMRRQDLNSTYLADEMHKGTSRIMDTFFRFNGVEKLTDWARAMASFAALSAIHDWHAKATNADGTVSQEAQEQARKELYDLGLTPEDIVLDETGELKILTYEEWADLADNPEERERDLRVRSAVHRFVDTSTVRPDASNRPLWMSNPYLAIPAQWKAFNTAFGTQILKPAWAKLVEEGNATPIMWLALTGIPIMIFADLIRDAVKMSMSDDEDEYGDKRWRPAWKAGWSMQDHLLYAVRRAGLYGADELAGQIIDPVLKGRPGEALAEIGGVAAGDARKVAKFGMNSFPVPLNDLTSNWGSSERAVAKPKTVKTQWEDVDQSYSKGPPYKSSV